MLGLTPKVCGCDCEASLCCELVFCMFCSCCQPIIRLGALVFMSLRTIRAEHTCFLKMSGKITFGRFGFCLWFVFGNRVLYKMALNFWSCLHLWRVSPNPVLYDARDGTLDFEANTPVCAYYTFSPGFCFFNFYFLLFSSSVYSQCSSFLQLHLFIHNM